jgi:HAE1 family hydrophobic/amphiphilic exporter-1
MGKRLPTAFIPEEDQGYAFLQLQLSDAASLQRTDSVMRKVDDILAHTHGVESYDGIAGFSLLSNTSSSYSGFYFIAFDPWDERHTPELSASALIRTLNMKLAAQVPEAIGFSFGPPAIPGLGTAGGFTFMLQDRSGGTVDQLYDALEKFVGTARKRPELSSLVSTFRPSVPQLYVDLDQDRVLTMEGLSASRARVSNDRRQNQQFLRAQFQGRHDPARIAGHDQTSFGPGVHQSLQSVSEYSDQWCAGTRV